jgi:hypothetical protein
MMTASIPAFDPLRILRKPGAHRVHMQPGFLLISMRARCAAARENFAELIPHRRP